MTEKTNPWTFDVRVRDRNLKAGTVTTSDVDTYLAALPDLAEQVTAFATYQPALQHPVVEVVDEGDDGDDDEDDDEDAVDSSDEASA